MNIVLLGGSGFIGTNLVVKLADRKQNNILVVDRYESSFMKRISSSFENVSFMECNLEKNTDFDLLLEKQDIVFHLVSSNIPATSNKLVAEELGTNIALSSAILDSCVRKKIKRIIFFSSGGTVYGKDAKCPIAETAETFPISSYGLQKLTIEKMLYLYDYLYGLDYRVIRLANPFGPYQMPNGILGAVSTFTYNALMNKEISVYGDGSVIRDYMYIDDAIEAVDKITFGCSEFKLFNVGSGVGTSIKELLKTISEVFEKELCIKYMPSRQADVPVNYLDISRYEKIYGSLNMTPLKEGIRKTSEFMMKYFV